MNPSMADLVMVVHGPEAFDAGDVERLNGLLSPRQVLVAGIMARTAAEESGLPATCTDERPSVVLGALSGPACMVNRGKTPESGRIFGELVAGRLAGLIHVECSDSTVYCWDNADERLAAAIAERTGYALVHATSTRTRREGVREIRGCIPGEAVFVNGIVIGTATEETVVLASEDGTIWVVSGLDPKPHGFEKLLRAGLPDLQTAWCKSGPVRRRAPGPGERAPRSGRVVVIDHCGHTLYRELEGEVCGVLSIGDDTTAVCGHICSHAGIPIFGVVDGDADAIIEPGYAQGSVVVEVVSGRDDDIGREIAAARSLQATCWEDWVEETLRALAGRVRVVLDLREE
ncbi:DUF2117 domain-containing protein [Methanoculleus thermophilus]|uniref:DUF2117 domain-containing protein n=1 Tax=Methanoculleus thermophilus TaxID=2200 RepID=A0A1G8XH36_9EURY|nr:DUF2117 domain-containing protein [Methanoculleus thermophilus]SDJ89949.1 hypothetical protein SAMN04488571_101439 [Methanoculleus thermophilus]